MGSEQARTLKSIRIELTKPFSDAVGTQELSVDFKGSDVMDLLNHLCNVHPDLKDHLFNEPGELTQYIIIFLNGKPLSAYADGTQTKLNDGDELLFMFPVSGG